MPVLTASVATDFAAQLFEAAGVPPGDARRVAQSLVDANLRGHDSHGLIRVLQYVGFLRDGSLRADAPLTALRETPAALALDAHWGLGQVQAYRTLQRLEPKAKSLGIAAATIRRCGHVGRLGEYAEWAAGRGLVLLAAVNSHGRGQRVAPPGGTRGRISTNPLCVGVPTRPEPLILDMGTSACAEGKVRVAFQKGEPVPAGLLLDSDGRPTTDPASLYADPPGTILPFGGEQAYKGFGLGLMVDLLCGGLSGGDCTRPDLPMSGVGNAVVFALLDPEQFAGQEHFARETARFADYVRSSPPAPGVEGITLPGDPERRAAREREEAGIDLPQGTWQRIASLAAELGVAVPQPAA